MGVENYSQSLQTGKRLRLELQHFARGTWPLADNRLSSMGVNRFFTVIANPSGAACRVEDEKNSLIFVPGHTYFIPVHHKACMHLDEKTEFVSVHFTLELFEGVDIFSRFERILEFPDPLWHDQAMKAFEEKNELISALLIRGAVSGFASAVIGTFTAAEWDEVNMPAVFQQELDYIRSRPPAAVTVEELAELRGVSRETFSRNFTRITGIPPKKLLNTILFNRSCRLLLNSGKTIREAAFELGFTNEYYFSRFFRKHAGMAPGEYRRRFK